MKDFFISYTGDDVRWAEWIAWQLEQAGYSVVLQAWDFTGNWVLRMDEAMAEATRTIAVLSPEYFQSGYTPSEWGNAFRRDPRAEEDLLIPVRIKPVELPPIFAQITYVDFVGVSEEAAAERLLQRVRRERRKPSAPPAFPAETTRTIAAKPPYPAEEHDRQRVLHARELLVRWRELYGARAQELQETMAKLNEWRHDLPETITSEAQDALNLAVEVGRDLRALPVRSLAFASNYGLLMHRGVYDEFAMDRVEHHAEVAHIMGPDAYALENAERVLNGALQLLRFRLDALPLGFIDAVAPAGDLSTHRTLLLVRKDSDPALHLVAVDSEVHFLGSFAARRLELHTACAWKTAAGTIDLVAEDHEHIYVWSDSQPHPSAQYEQKGMILAAAREPETEDAALIIDSYGAIRILSAAGEEHVIRRPADHLTAAAVWIDPLCRSQWYVHSLTRAFDLTSQSRDGELVRREAITLWEESQHWYSNAYLVPTTLAGFPCLVAHRQAWFGEGVQFLDPVSLRSLRPSLFISNPITDLVLAAGRWLVVFFMHTEERIAVWDLAAGGDQPAHRFRGAGGEAYRPFVAWEGDGVFEVLFVLNRYDTRRSILCRFRFPEGSVEELAEFTDLRILPIEPRA